MIELMTVLSPCRPRPSQLALRESLHQMADAKITRFGRLQPQHGFLSNLQLSIACSKDTDVAGGYMAAQQNGASGKAGCTRIRHGHDYKREADQVRQAE